MNTHITKEKNNLKLKLKKVDINIFKKIIYPEYLKLFAIEERKTLSLIESLFNKGILNIIEITDKDLFIGFMLINKITDSKYIQLDYFAILPQYQCKGLGTKALSLLKKIYNQYHGIFVEVEKLDLNINDEDNKIRQRRINFYKNSGFYKLNLEFCWFNSLVLTPYILLLSKKSVSDEIILDNILSIYLITHGQEKLNKNLKIIKSQ